MTSEPFDRGSRSMRPGVRHSVATPRDRRSVLKILAVNGFAIPSLAVLGAGRVVGREPEAPAQSEAGGPQELIREFADPLLELTRLLRKAAEMEHAILVQYTYAAFSVKPDYQVIGAYGAGGALNLLGLAIDKMMHLGAVNRLLMAVGAEPHLSSPRFPVAPGVYPFELGLEPLSRQSLARHLYCEAPIGFFADTDASLPDRELAAAVRGMIGTPATHPASLYAAIAETAEEAGRAAGAELPSMAHWIVAMRKLADRDDDDRLQFLKDLFRGSHPVFAGTGNVWRLPAEDPGYPAYPLPSNPTVEADRPGRIADPTAAALARLGNLQYWTSLLLLDLHFRHRIRACREMAVAHMMGPVRSLGRHLPTLGAGLPFDALDIPISSGADAKHRLRFVTALLQEGQVAAEAIATGLPPDYPLSINRNTLIELRGLPASNT
jgi:hypothetical protein